MNLLLPYFLPKSYSYRCLECSIISNCWSSIQRYISKETNGATNICFGLLNTSSITSFFWLSLIILWRRMYICAEVYSIVTMYYNNMHWRRPGKLPQCFRLNKTLAYLVSGRYWNCISILEIYSPTMPQYGERCPFRQRYSRPKYIHCKMLHSSNQSPTSSGSAILFSGQKKWSWS